MTAPGTDVFLTTARLILRDLTPADAGALHALYNDAEVMRYLNGGKPVPREEIEQISLPRVLHTSPDTGLRAYWAVEERATDTFLGWLHLRPRGEVTGRPDAEVMELGYRLARRSWGRGYATEASRAVIEYAFTHLGTERIMATAMTVNSASRSVMEKCGLAHERTFFPDWDDPIDGSEHGEVEYGLTRDDWETKRAVPTG